MRIHRLLAGSLTVTATVAAGSFVAAPAHAALTSPQLTAVTAINHASGCTASASGGSSNTTFTDGGSPVTQTQSAAGTVSNGGDVTQVAATGKGTIAVSHAGGSLSTVDYTGTASAKAVPSSSATACNAVTYGYSYATFGFTLAHPGWFTISTDGSSSGYAFSSISVGGGAFSVSQQANGTRMTGRSQLFIPQAGAYSMTIEYGVESAASTATLPQQSKLAMKMHLVYTQAGGAPAAASGSGSSYVRLAGARNCTGDNVAATFTSKATKATTATFYVNGVKKKTVHHPSGGTSALLGGLADTSPVTVRAVLALKQGGSVSTSRSYVPCS